jgi:hypothetical protein
LFDDLPKAMQGSGGFPIFDAFEQPKAMHGCSGFPLFDDLSQPKQGKASGDFPLFDPFPQAKDKGPENEKAAKELFLFLRRLRHSEGLSAFR